MPIFDLSNTPLRELNSALHALSEGANDTEFEVVNPRGSQGYGEDFALCIRTEWGDKDYADVMAGVDAAMDSRSASASTQQRVLVSSASSARLTSLT